MVKGNKFKPGEPPLKKRKLLDAAVLESSTAQTTCDVLTARQTSEEPNGTQPIKGAHGTVASHGPKEGQEKVPDTAACNRKRNKLQTDAGNSGGPAEAVAPPQERAVQNGDPRQQTARGEIRKAERKAERKMKHLIPAGMPEAAVQAEAALDYGVEAKRRRKQKVVQQSHEEQQIQTSVAQPQQGAAPLLQFCALR